MLIPYIYLRYKIKEKESDFFIEKSPMSYIGYFELLDVQEFYLID